MKNAMQLKAVIKNISKSGTPTEKCSPLSEKSA